MPFSRCPHHWLSLGCSVEGVETDWYLRALYILGAMLPNKSRTGLWKAQLIHLHSCWQQVVKLKFKPKQTLISVLAFPSGTNFPIPIAFSFLQLFADWKKWRTILPKCKLQITAQWGQEESNPFHMLINWLCIFFPAQENLQHPSVSVYLQYSWTTESEQLTVFRLSLPWAQTLLCSRYG